MAAREKHEVMLEVWYCPSRSARWREERNRNSLPAAPRDRCDSWEKSQDRSSVLRWYAARRVSACSWAQRQTRDRAMPAGGAIPVHSSTLQLPVFRRDSSTSPPLQGFLEENRRRQGNHWRTRLWDRGAELVANRPVRHDSSSA